MSVELKVLALTVLAMGFVWWAHGKWRGKGYMTVLHSVFLIAVGAFVLYFVMADVLSGQMPAHYRAMSALWVIMAVLMIGWGAYDLREILQAMTRGSRERVTHSRYGNRGSILWAVTAICVVGLGALLLAAKHATDFAESARYPREPLKLRLDHDTK